MMNTWIFSTLMAVCCAKIVNFKDCGSMGGKISSIDINPCDTEPCQLHRGTNYSIALTFEATEDSKTATTAVYGIIAGIPVPFPVPADSCKNGNVQCPIAKGSTVVYNNAIFCDPKYPTIRLVVKWEIKDDNNQDLICFEIPLAIVS